MNEKEKMKLAPPWVAHANAMKALFREDPEVRVEYDEDAIRVKIYVETVPKAEALAQLLPDHVEFGNVHLGIEVIPANVEKTTADLFYQAFSGNDAVKEFIQIDGVFTNPVTYIVFKKEVVQFWNDDLSDPHGNRSTLYQDLASEIFRGHGGILFCTDDGEEEE